MQVMKYLPLMLKILGVGVAITTLVKIMKSFREYLEESQLNLQCEFIIKQDTI